MTKPIDLAMQALEVLRTEPMAKTAADKAQALLEQIEKATQVKSLSIKDVAKKAGINLPETYIPTIDDAVAAGNSVLMNEQAALLRECRAALDSLIAQRPTLAGLLCGSTTLGNLKAELGAYRPQGVFGTAPPPRKPLTIDEIEQILARWDYELHGDRARFIVRETETAHGITGGSMIDLLRRALAPRREWVNLTEEEIDELWKTTFKNNKSINEFCRAIEAKLKEKNHGWH